MENVLRVLWLVSWQAGVLAGVVWVVTRLARKAPASWRHALWLLVLVKLFVPPFVQVPGEWAFWVTSGEQRVESREQSADGTGQSFRAPEESASSASQQQIPPFGPNDNTSMVPEMLSGTQSAENPFPLRNWPTLAGIAWLIGIAFMSAVFLRRFSILGGIVRASRPSGDRWCDTLADAATSLRIRKLPEIRLSDRVSTPMLAGFFRPVILLPSGIESVCSESDILAILSHELAHIRRRDVAASWFTQFAQALFFFHPAPWLAGHQMRRERELACDEMVLATSGITRDSYAAGYVSALKLANRQHPNAGALAMAEPFDLEKRRIESIRRGVVPRMTGWWVVVLVLLAAVGLATISGCGKMPRPGAYHNRPGEYSYTYQFPKPPVWARDSFKIRLDAISREESEEIGKQFVTHISYKGEPASFNLDPDSVKVTDPSGRTLSSYWLDTSPGRGEVKFDMPAKPLSGIGKLAGSFDNSYAVQREYGPYILDEARKPIICTDRQAAYLLVDCQTMDITHQMILDEESPMKANLDSDDRGYVIVRYYGIQRNETVESPQLAVYGSDGKWHRTLDSVCSIGGDFREFESHVPYFGYELDTSFLRDEDSPARVASVSGPAAKVGMRIGDVITRLDGKAVKSSDLVLRPWRSGIRVGKAVSITVMRNGEEVHLQIVPTIHPMWKGMSVQDGKIAAARLAKLVGAGRDWQVFATAFVMLDQVERLRHGQCVDARLGTVYPSRYALYNPPHPL